MNHYRYLDNLNGRKVVFECEAASIVEADGRLKDATGIEASKSPHIACQIEEMHPMTVEYGSIALEYLARFKPFSKERIGEASKSEMRRWFDQGSVQINEKASGWEDCVFPNDVKSLVLFPKGKRVTLL